MLQNHLDTWTTCSGMIQSEQEIWARWCSVILPTWPTLWFCLIRLAAWLKKSSWLILLNVGWTRQAKQLWDKGTDKILCLWNCHMRVCPPSLYVISKQTWQLTQWLLRRLLKDSLCFSSLLPNFCPRADCICRISCLHLPMHNQWILERALSVQILWQWDGKSVHAIIKAIIALENENATSLICCVSSIKPQRQLCTKL